MRFRRRMKFVPQRLERNHCEMSFTTAAATESQQVITTALDDTTNRSTQIPTGAILKRMVVRLWATDATPVTGKHQCMLYYRPGATAIATPIASWFSTTNPITEENHQIRQLVLGKHPGVHTQFVVTGAAFPLREVCTFRGNRLMHDGDDIVLTQLDTNITNWEGVCDYTYVA